MCHFFCPCRCLVKFHVAPDFRDRCCSVYPGLVSTSANSGNFLAGFARFLIVECFLKFCFNQKHSVFLRSTDKVGIKKECYFLNNITLAQLSLEPQGPNRLSKLTQDRSVNSTSISCFFYFNQKVVQTGWLIRKGSMAETNPKLKVFSVRDLCGHKFVKTQDDGLICVLSREQK